MYRQILLILCLILTACGPAETEAPATTEVPAPTVAPAMTEAPTATEEATATEEPLPTEALEDTPWDKPYEEIAAELCKPTEIPTDRPGFRTSLNDGTLGGLNVFVHHGLFANSQRELFRIDVTGLATPAGEAAVKAYTADLKVCLDYIPIGDTLQDEPEPTQPPSTVTSPFGTYPQDLLIEIYPEGVLDSNMTEEEVDAAVEAIVSAPFENWRAQYDLQKLQMPEVLTDFVLDFNIDPSVSNNGRHQYTQKRAAKIWVSISVAAGSGSVKAGICRGALSTPITGSVMTVTNGGTPDTDERSYNPGVERSYELSVKGNSSGRYRISGRSLWPSWLADYFAAAPTGSTKDCNP